MSDSGEVLSPGVLSRPLWVVERSGPGLHREVVSSGLHAGTKCPWVFIQNGYAENSI